MTACVACPVDTFAVDAGATHCVRCTSGRYTEGQTAQTACLRIPTPALTPATTPAPSLELRCLLTVIGFGGDANAFDDTLRLQLVGALAAWMENATHCNASNGFIGAPDVTLPPVLGSISSTMHNGTSKLLVPLLLGAKTETDAEQAHMCLQSIDTHTAAFVAVFCALGENSTLSPLPSGFSVHVGNATVSKIVPTPAPHNALQRAASSRDTIISGSVVAVVLLLLFVSAPRLKKTIQQRHAFSAHMAAHSTSADHSGMEMRSSSSSSNSSVLLTRTNPIAYQPPAPIAAAGNESAQRVSVPARAFTSDELKTCTSNFTSPIGQGAYGTVYCGLLADGRRVAVKQMVLGDTALKKGTETTATLSTGAKKYKGEAGFRRELEALGSCTHDNVVLLFGYCIETRTTGPSMFSLVLEFMPGGSLLRALEHGQRRPTLVALQRLCIASDVARGLHYLHTEAMLVHQDVKSDNVLLTEVGGHIVAKVADFGTARVVPKQDTKTHHSTKTIIGSTPYMPMEYLQSGRVSEKTDTFAFGIILCELLTGKPPVDRDTGEMLVFEMQLALQRPETLSLDTRAGSWPRGTALNLARVAGKCINPFDHSRCSVREVLQNVDVLAGRKTPPVPRTTTSRRPLSVAAATALHAPGNKWSQRSLSWAGAAGSHAPSNLTGATMRVCPICGSKLRLRAGIVLPCFTCKRNQAQKAEAEPTGAIW